MDNMSMLFDWVTYPWPPFLKWGAVVAFVMALFGLLAIAKNSRLNNAMRKLKQRTQQLEDELTEQKVLSARYEEQRIGFIQHIEQQKREAEALKNDYLQMQALFHKAQTALATSRETAALNRQHLEEKLQLLEENKQNLLNEFSQVSERIFSTKAAQNRQGLGEILTPFKEQLRHLQNKVEQLYLEESKDRAGLKVQLNELHKLNREMTDEAHALATALRGQHKMQGSWGELVLERVLERSGLRLGEEYQREVVLSSGQQSFRPDVLIQLPDKRHLIIDSKVSLNAYIDYVNADSDLARDKALKAHIAALRQHITGLGNKAYQQLEGVNTPDFVLMFLPIEAAFMAAFSADEHLFDEAFARKIAVVTPTTLLATLRTVSSIWAVERRNASTEQLADEASKVYDKLALLIERMEKLGKQLDTVKKSYDETWHGLTSGNGNLVSTVERFRDVGIRSKKTIARSISTHAKATDLTNDSVK